MAGKKLTSDQMLTAAQNLVGLAPGVACTGVKYHVYVPKAS
jgi:hypothetical protein